MPSHRLRLLLLAVCLAASFPRCSSHGFQHPLLLSRQRRSLIFTEDAYAELFVSVAWPVPLERQNLLASVGFTADFGLPTNASQLYAPGSIRRGARAAGEAGGRAAGRLAVYAAIQRILARYGFEGRACLLRSICEMATTSVRHNGLIGDVLHIILTWACALLLLLLLCCAGPASGEWERLLSRQRRKVLFTDASSMGILLALATPIDLPGRDVSFSYNFEANYALPSNLTQLLQYDFSPLRRQRSLDRRHAYRLLEQRFQREGLVGRACVLRTVCEVSQTPVRHNGLVGDLLHIFFTPSTSTEEGLPLEFLEAEQRGRRGADCATAYAACRHSPLDLISVVI